MPTSATLGPTPGWPRFRCPAPAGRLAAPPLWSPGSGSPGSAQGSWLPLAKALKNNLLPPSPQHSWGLSEGAMAESLLF